MPPICDDGSCGDMGGSDLLKALACGMGGDPYGQPPSAPDQMSQGLGQGDPNMGIQQMLQMFALGQIGVGGPGGPGVDPGGGQIGSYFGF